MRIHAERMWNLMSPDGRREVMIEIRRIGNKTDEVWDGIPETKLAHIDDYDDLPPNLSAPLLIVGSPEGWQYSALTLFLGIVSSGGFRD